MHPWDDLSLNADNDMFSDFTWVSMGGTKRANHLRRSSAIHADQEESISCNSPILIKFVYLIKFYLFN